MHVLIILPLSLSLLPSLSLSLFVCSWKGLDRTIVMNPRNCRKKSRKLKLKLKYINTHTHTHTNKVDHYNHDSFHQNLERAMRDKNSTLTTLNKEKLHLHDENEELIARKAQLEFSLSDLQQIATDEKNNRVREYTNNIPKIY